jgi:hypothetical protein
LCFLGCRKISWPGGALALHLAALADDGSIAPDPRRLARAHLAGLRPVSPFLLPGVLCLALVGGLRWLGPGLLRDLRAQWELAIAGGGFELAGLMPGVLRGFGAVALVVLGMSALGGRLGWVDPSAGRGLGVGSQRSGMRGVLALLVPVVVVLMLASVCAGAARAVDASEAGLLALWWAWVMRLLFGVGCLLVLVGVFDRTLARQRLWRALHQSVEEVRRGEE